WIGAAFAGNDGTRRESVIREAGASRKCVPRLELGNESERVRIIDDATGINPLAQWSHLVMHNAQRPDALGIGPLGQSQDLTPGYFISGRSSGAAADLSRLD